MIKARFTLVEEKAMIKSYSHKYTSLLQETTISSQIPNYKILPLQLDLSKSIQAKEFITMPLDF